jgi:polar amino acid transport system substrate-binding protein
MPVFFLVIAFAALLFRGPLQAQAEQRLRVAYTEWRPYTYTEAGTPAGFEIEILTEVLAGMGVTPVFTSYPWKRCLAYLESGDADALVSLLKTEEREAYALFPEEPISVSKTSFFRLSDARTEYSGDLAQLKGRKIGVIAGFDYGPDFERASFLDKDASVDPRGLLTKLLLRRIDLAAENEAVFSAEAARQGASGKIVALSPPLQVRLLYVGFSKAKRLDEFSRRFSEALAAFKKTARYPRILEKYGAAPSTQ